MKERSVAMGGEHVALAAMTEADQTKFCLWLQSAELRTLIHDPRIPSLEDQMQWFRRVQKSDRMFFSLVTVPDGVLIGNCGFVDIDASGHEATLRITIGNPDYIGKGFGTEAVELLVRYGFSSMNLKRISLKVLASNDRAIRTYEKVGFVRESENMSDGKKIVTMILSQPSRT